MHGSSFVRLGTAQQLLQPSRIFETLLERLVGTLAVNRAWLSVQPQALLLGGEEKTQAFCAARVR